MESKKVSDENVSSERFLSILAIILSFMALSVSIYQAYSNNNFNKLSIMPHLQINPKLTSNNESGLYIENAGTGTAYINSISLEVKGKTFDFMEENSSEFLNSLGVRSICYKVSWPRKGAAIQAGKEFPLIKVRESNISLCQYEAIKFLSEPDAILNISYTTPYNKKLNFSEKISLTKRELGKYYELIDKIKK